MATLLYVIRPFLKEPRDSIALGKTRQRSVQVRYRRLPSPQQASGSSARQQLDRRANLWIFGPWHIQLDLHEPINRELLASCRQRRSDLGRQREFLRMGVDHHPRTAQVERFPSLESIGRTKPIHRVFTRKGKTWSEPGSGAVAGRAVERRKISQPCAWQCSARVMLWSSRRAQPKPSLARPGFHV